MTRNLPLGIELFIEMVKSSSSGAPFVQHLPDAFSRVIGRKVEFVITEESRIEVVAKTKEL